MSSLTDWRSRIVRRLLEQAGMSQAPPLPAPIMPRSPGDVPLTPAQEAIWLLQRTQPYVAAYNVAVAYRIHGVLDLALVEQALHHLVARYGALRTIVFPTENGPRARVLSPAAVPLVRCTPAQIAAHAAAPFELGESPAFRAVVARQGERDHLLMLVTHHLLTDAASCAILWRELAALYATLGDGRAPSLPPVTLDFADYAAWRCSNDVDRERVNAYWRSHLADVEPLQLPTDRADGASFDGDWVRRALSRRAQEAVRRITARGGVTTYMVLLAAWQTVLHRRTEQDDIVVGSAVVGRTHAQTEAMVGYFAQALPMRTSFRGDPTFRELLGRVAATVVGAVEHQDVSLEAIMESAGIGAGSLFRAVLTMTEGLPPRLAFGASTALPVDVELPQTKFDLTLFPIERDDELQCTLWFRTALFERDTAERLLTQFERVLEAAGDEECVRVSSIELLDVRERSIIAAASAGPPVEAPSLSVAATVAETARRCPTRLALACGDRRLDYAALDAAVSQLASAVQTHDASSDGPVAIVAESSIETVVAMLAVERAGRAFVPLAPDASALRLGRQLASCRARLVIASAEAAARLGELEHPTIVVTDALPEPSGDPGTPTWSADDTAYVMLTSGTTGVPKGVVVTHGNVAAYTGGIIDRLGLERDVPLRFAVCTTLAADLGYTSVLAALATGGTLEIVPADAARDPAAFAEILASGRIDVLKTTPSHLHALLEATDDALPLPRRWLILGGEPLRWPLAERLLRRPDRPRILNHYGPTETTIGACAFELAPESAARVRALGARTVPIGLPLPGVRVSVRDRYGNEAAPGVPGELWIAGSGVGAGYVGDGALSAHRFAEVAGFGRAYRTGDRVRRFGTGEIEFLTRADRQIKLHGFRIELGEIESALADHPAVERAIVVRDPSGSDTCVAYLLVRTGTPEDVSERIRAHAAALLPASILPSAFVVLDALPLTPNGKLDLTALPSPAASRTDVPVDAPATATESRLAAMWGEAIGREHVGTRDDFFALGGHSLAAIRVLGRISREFSVRLPLRAMFDAPTVIAMARLIEERRATGAVATATIARVDRSRPGEVS